MVRRIGLLRTLSEEATGSLTNSVSETLSSLAPPARSYTVQRCCHIDLPLKNKMHESPWGDARNRHATRLLILFWQGSLHTQLRERFSIPNNSITLTRHLGPGALFTRARDVQTGLPG